MQGLQVFGADGVEKFSTQNRLARILGTWTVSGTGNSGSFFVPGMNTGEPFTIVSVAPQANTIFNAFPAFVTINAAAQTVSWSINANQLASIIVVCVY